MTARRWWAVSAISLGVFATFYVVFVLTPWGQQVDDELLEWFRAESLTRTALTNALHLINVSTIAITGIVVILIGVIRRRLPIGFVAAFSFGMAIVIAEVFKLVLPRPEHQPEMDAALGRVGVDTYPSGHSTIITAGVIALLWAWGTARRSVWMLGAGIVLVVVSATVIAGWHRPSDGVGGVSIAVAVMSAAAAIMAWRATRPALPDQTSRLPAA